MFDNLKKIKLIATDFDGIITDGFVYLSSEQTGEMKKVSFKDIMGMSLALKNDYKIAIISGEKNSIIDKIADKFKLDDVHQGIKDKLSVLLSIAQKYSLSLDQICFLGDDINDISALEEVGFAVTIPDSNYKVKNIPNIYITKANGGNGAFREIIDLLLD
ncbi:MAG: HAD hydrolase family protein [Candidatus Gastranaerophilales bacterium]|nr:HAD hydrolase family protein [Candidatus Gastranaerophilales bacterium]